MYILIINIYHLNSLYYILFDNLKLIHELILILLLIYK